MASEKFDHSVTVSAGGEIVWAALIDVDRLARWVGIVHSVEEISHLEKYTAVLEDRVGPFKLRADLDVAVVVPKDGFRIEVSASGRDRSVDSKITIDCRLELARSGGHTTVHVEGGYKVTGRVASMGGGIIRKKADGILNDFFASVERELDDAPLPDGA